MAFEQTVKNLDNCLRTDKGCTSELDYVEQTSWILFLKYLDDLEKSKQIEAELQDKTYQPIIAEGYRWNDWAMPRTKTGEYDTANALVGDDLIDFVNGKLFPYLRKFRETGRPKSIEIKIGVIFSEIRNRIQSGYNLRDILEQVDTLRFQTTEERHEMTYWYESRLNRMGNAGRNGGEYYTPRPLIRAIVKVVDPQIGKTVYDGACGSAGFLCEAYNYMHEHVKKTDDEKFLQTETFTGKDDKALPYIIATMNMILHGVESPNIINTNTLTENLADVQEKDRFDYILANPPFGGKERPEVQQNFTIKTGETAYLFLEHFIKYLRAGGQAGIVIQNTFLSKTSDNASIALRKKLLEECNLHTVLVLPPGVFQAGVKTVVLFFKKGEPTRKVWFYQLNLDRTLGKTDPLNDKDLSEFVELQKTKSDGPNSWTVKVADLNENYDLSPKNPNKVEIVDERTPEEIAKEIDSIANLSCELSSSAIQNASSISGWVEKRLGDIAVKMADGPFGSNLKKEHYTEKPEVRIIQLSNIREDGWGEANKKYTTFEHLKTIERSEVNPNDIVIAKMMPAGRAIICPDHEKKFVLSSDAVKVEIKKGLDLKYVLYSINSPYFREQVYANVTGSGRVRTSLTKLRECKLRIPAIEEQKRMVSVLDEEFAKIDAMKENAKKLEQLCDDLKEALLRKAFNGE